MARNIELKARSADPKRQRETAASLSGPLPEVIRQEDFFFGVPRGRLKLRLLGEDRGELIYYEREDLPGPKPSEYHLCPTADPRSLARVLERALGLRGVVRKTRTLYRAGRTRIHFDQVEGLGSFIELEVVLAPGEDPAEGEKEARRLASELGIDPADLLERAYVDLLEDAAPTPQGP